MHNQYRTLLEKKLSNIPDEYILKRGYSGTEDILCHECFSALPNGKGREITKHIASGITVTFRDYLTRKIPCQNKENNDFLEIDYCRYGRIGCNTKDGHSMYLGPSDFCVHTKQLCNDSAASLPSGYYEGFTICINFMEFDKTPPELLTGTGITGKMLYEKYCTSKSFSMFAGNENTEAIFSWFYQLPEPLKHPYFALKTLELILYLGNFETSNEKRPDRYSFEQIETIREIHDYLLLHLGQRITIKELSRKFLMNPTTLKAAFKTVYGDSLAAHMNEHRIEHAAALLCNTTESLSQIAKAVGYKNQSRFSTAFKSIYQMSPLEYRKTHALSN